MPPTNPRKNGPPKQPSEQKPSTSLEPGFPALQKETATMAPKTKYEEAQDEEMLVLEAIYGEEFQRVDVEGAGVWKKRQPCFRIHVTRRDPRRDVKLPSVVLQVEMTATYPKSTPVLSISKDEDLKETTRQKIKHVIATKPKELIKAEQPIIHHLIDLILDVLDEEANADATALPSLEAEREVQEYDAAQAARAAEAEAQRQKELKLIEERAAHDAMVQIEIDKRAKVTEGKRRDRRASMDEASATELSEKTLSQRVTFDQRIKVTDQDNNMVLFQSVTGKNHIRTGPVAKVYTVRPIAIGGDNIPTLVLKQTELKNVASEALMRQHMHELETELEKVKKFRHRNLLELHDFKFHKNGAEGESGSTQSEGSLWTVTLLTEYANKGSLEEILQVAGDLPIARARAWTIDLLDGLAFLQEKNIIHKHIHTANVLLIRNSAGEIKAKLADGGYQKELHLLGRKLRNGAVLSVAKSARWLAPEKNHGERSFHTHKTDVWDFGIVFLNMVFGLNVLQKYTSPTNLAAIEDLTPSLYEFVQKIFRSDHVKRPRASELRYCDFLATDAEALVTGRRTSLAPLSLHSTRPNTPIRPRKPSAVIGTSGTLSLSRYKEDFVEEGELGKGGYGVVMKVRQKLDGQFYAVKKIVQKRSSATLTGILKEVRVLSTLSHPHVVRYYTTWTEEVDDDSGNEQAILSDTEDEDSAADDLADGEDGEAQSDESSSTDQADDDGLDIVFGRSTGDLDYMNSQVEFEYDTEEADDEDDDEYTEDEPEADEPKNDEPKKNDAGGSTGEVNGHDRKELPTRQTRSSSRIRKSTRTILYIQMEFCARRTLADLIRGDLYKDNDEIWRLFRQMLDALFYLHDKKIVHRDLKPANVFMDNSGKIRIGDFGLATNGQTSFSEKNAPTNEPADMTLSVGTFYYVAPEVRSSGGGHYGIEVDMYSLGIIFFEMCYHSIVGMERVEKMTRLRDAKPRLPEDFDMSDKEKKADIILSLVKHNPKERPSAEELLYGGKLPQSAKEETMKQVVAQLSDPDSVHYNSVKDALFSLPVNPAKDTAWDMTSTRPPSSNELLIQSIVKERLTNIFRLHGALEIPRTTIFPNSKHYDLVKTVKLLDPSGLLMQLPYDLTLPNARALAKQPPSVLRSFAFGETFRPGHVGGQPLMVKEVHFDIVSPDTLDLAMKDAEVIKVMDEIIGNTPSLDTSKFSIYLNHADFLPLIFQFCRIDSSKHDRVAQTLSQLNVSNWSQIRPQLRGPLIGMSSASVNDLQQFDFNDLPEKACKKLKDIFHGSELLEKASSAIERLNDVVKYLDRFQVKTKFFISPLSNMSQSFYKGGIMFQCVSEYKKKDVFIAGGRYDSLIREYRNQASGKYDGLYAVGFNFNWGKLMTFITTLQQSTAKNFLKKKEALNGLLATRRCDVLVASFDPSTLRLEGTQIVAKLWAQDISAELAVDARSLEDLQAKYSKDPHCWHVIIKHDSMLKIKSFVGKDQPDADIQASQLVSYLRGEIRERDQLNGTYEKTRFNRHGSQAVEAPTPTHHDQPVTVVFAETKSKKGNRQYVVEQAQEKAASLANSFLDGPIAAVETTDKILHMIGETTLYDNDSWREVIHNSPVADRSYIKTVQTELQNLATKHKETTRHAFLYNFRTGTCIYYDLGTESLLRPSGKGKERTSSDW